MAVENLVRTKCDRCKSVIEEVVNAGTGENREQKLTLYVEQDGAPPIEFMDLCKKCADRVDSLCMQLRLEKEEKVAPVKAKSSQKKSKDQKADQGETSSLTN